LQLFAHPEDSEWFSTIFVVIFEVNIVAEQNQAFFTAPPAPPLLWRHC